MMTSSDDEAANLAKAKQLLLALEDALEGTGFAITSTRTITAAMVPSLECLTTFATSYKDALLREGVRHDVATLLEDAGLLLETHPGSPHVAALDSIKAILGPDASEAQAEAWPVKVSLERARESIRGLEDEVASLTFEMTSAAQRLDARLNVMLTGPLPEAWASTTEGFELQVLLLLELKFASALGFNANNGNLLQEQYAAFRRPRFPNCGCRSLSAVTDDFALIRKALAAFHSSLMQKYAPPAPLVRSPRDQFASARG